MLQPDPALMTFRHEEECAAYLPPPACESRCPTARHKRKRGECSTLALRFALRHLRPAQVERDVRVEVRRDLQLQLGRNRLERSADLFIALHRFQSASLPKELSRAEAVEAKGESDFIIQQRALTADGLSMAKRDGRCPVIRTARTEQSVADES